MVKVYAPREEAMQTLPFFDINGITVSDKENMELDSAK